MIWIDTILKHVKTQNENMTKYAKFEQMAHEMLLTEDKAIPWIAASKSSDQKWITQNISIFNNQFWIFWIFDIGLETLKNGVKCHSIKELKIRQGKIPACSNMWGLKSVRGSRST